MREEGQYHRQLDLVNIKTLQQTEFAVVGAGALGSFTALTLAKLGVEKLSVYDNDTIEEHNLPMQFYRRGDLGKPKVEALAELIQDFEGVDIDAHNCLFDNTDADVVISAVDSMEARRDVYSKLGLCTTTYIDCRAGGEVGTIFCLVPGDEGDVKTRYEENIKDTDVFSAPCTSKMTTYIAVAMASHVAAIIAHMSQGAGFGPSYRTFDMHNCLTVLRDPSI